MRAKYEFEKVEMDGQIMAVPVGAGTDELHSLLRLNDTAAFILDCLKEETTEEAVIEKVRQVYTDADGNLEAFVREYIEKLRESGIVE